MHDYSLCHYCPTLLDYSSCTTVGRYPPALWRCANTSLCAVCTVLLRASNQDCRWMKTGGEERRCCSQPSAANCSTSARPAPAHSLVRMATSSVFLAEAKFLKSWKKILRCLNIISSIWEYHLSCFLSLSPSPSPQSHRVLTLTLSAFCVAFFGSSDLCWCVWAAGPLKTWIGFRTPGWGVCGSTHWFMPCCVSHTHTSVLVSGTNSVFSVIKALHRQYPGPFSCSETVSVEDVGFTDFIYYKCLYFQV